MAYTESFTSNKPQAWTETDEASRNEVTACLDNGPASEQD